MLNLSSIVEKLTDEELKEAFLEIVEWRDTEVLKENGIVHKIHGQFMESIDGYFPPNLTEISINLMEIPFLFEIAKRHYAKDEA